MKASKIHTFAALKAIPTHWRIVLALALFCLVLAPGAQAANGTAYYFDINGTGSGFGSPSGTYSYSVSDWTTSTAGTTTPVGWQATCQPTFGFNASDFSGNTFTINFDGGSATSWNGLLINANNANVTFIGTQNAYILNTPVTWTVAAGSTFTENMTFNGFGLNFNNSAVTLSGGGTINFGSSVGYNDNSTITENMTGTVNLNADWNAGTANQANYMLTAGTLNFHTANALNGLGHGGTLLSINGGTIDNTSVSPLTLGLGTGTYSIGGNFTFTGSSSLNLGIYAVTLGTAVRQITVSANTITLGGIVSGSGGGITKLGGGTLTLSGANTFSGNTLISGGKVALGNALALQNSAFDTASVNGGLDVTGYTTPTLGGLTGSGNLSSTLITGYGSVTTLTLNPQTGSQTYSGNIVNGASGMTLTKSGTGAQILSSANSTYSGGTTLSAGTLTLGASSTPTSGTVTSGPLGTGTLTLSGGTLNITGAGRTIANALSLTASTTTTVNAVAGANFTLTGSITGSGTFANNAASGQYNSLIVQGDISGFTGTFNFTDTDNANNLIFNGTTAASQNGSGAKFALSGVTSATNLRGVNVGATGASTFQMGELSGTGGVINGNVSGITLQVGALNTSTSFSGLLAGANLGLNKVGSGTLTLAFANTFTGGVAINNGTLKLGNAGALNSITPNAVTLNAGTLDLNTYVITMSSLSGTGGTLTDNSSGAATTTLTVNQSGNTTFSGNIVNGSAKIMALIKSGAGTLTLTPTSGNNNYGGTTTVSAGKLVVQSSQSGTGNISISDSAALGVTVSGTSQLSPGILTLGSSTGATLEFNGITSAALATAPLNPTTVVLNGTTTVNINSASGLLAGNSYKLLANAGASLGAYNLTTQPPGIIGTLALQSGTLVYTVTSVSDIWNVATPGGNWDIGATAGWAGNAVNNSPVSTYQNSDRVLFDDTASGPNTVTVAAAVTPSAVVVNNSLTAYTIASSGANLIDGSGSITKSGTASLTLSGGVNTYSGATTINGGTVSVGALANGGSASDMGAPANSAANLKLNGGTLKYTGSATSSDRLFTVGTAGATLDASGTGALNLNNSGSAGLSGSGTRTLTLTGTSTAGNALAAIIGDNGGATSLTKSGAGSWTLSGVNTYSGTTTISTGTLALGAANAIPNETGKGSVSVAGTLDVAGFSAVINGLNGAGVVDDVAAGGSPVLTIGGSGDTSTFSGAIKNTTGSLGLTKSGAGTLTLSGASSTYFGGTTLSAGTLTLGASSTPTSGTVTSGPLGTGTLTLSGGTLTDSGAACTIANAIYVTPATTSTAYAVTLYNLTLTGPITGSGTIYNNAPAGQTYSFVMQGDMSGFTGTFSFNSVLNGNNLIFNGVTAASQNGSGAKFLMSGATSGTGLHYLYGGSTTIPFQIGELSGTGGVLVPNYNLGGTVTFQIGALNTSPAAYSGLITDNGTSLLALTKVGNGTLTLAGANTYTVGTTVSSGTLLVNNTSGSGTGSGTVTVNGGTLGGSGTISGAVTVNSGGSLTVGGTSGAPGTLTINNALTLAGNTTLRINKGGTGDLIQAAAGSPNLLSGGTLNLANVGGALAGGDTFTLFSGYTFGGTAPAAGTLPSLGTGLNWYLGNVPLNGTITINRAPVAGTQYFSVNSNATLTVSAATLAGLSYDADGNPLTITGVSSTSTNGGSVTLSGGYLSYTPVTDFVGADQFTYTIDDGRGGTAAVTAKVTVRAAKPAFNAQAIDASTPGQVTVRGYGIPGHQYDIQRSANADFSGTIDILGTITAAGNGVVSFTDTSPLGPMGFYRLAVH